MVRIATEYPGSMSHLMDLVGVLGGGSRLVQGPGPSIPATVPPAPALARGEGFLGAPGRTLLTPRGKVCVCFCVGTPMDADGTPRVAGFVSYVVCVCVHGMGAWVGGWAGERDGGPQGPSGGGAKGRKRAFVPKFPTGVRGQFFPLAPTLTGPPVSRGCGPPPSHETPAHGLWLSHSIPLLGGPFPFLAQWDLELLEAELRGFPTGPKASCFQVQRANVLHLFRVPGTTAGASLLVIVLREPVAGAGYVVLSEPATGGPGPLSLLRSPVLGALKQALPSSPEEVTWEGALTAALGPIGKPTGPPLRCYNGTNEGAVHNVGKYVDVSVSERVVCVVCMCD